VFYLRIFRENADIVKDAETHRIILLGMVTRWSKITLLYTFYTTDSVSLHKIIKLMALIEMKTFSSCQVGGMNQPMNIQEQSETVHLRQRKINWGFTYLLSALVHCKQRGWSH